MNAICTYRIRVRGHADEAQINRMGPVRVVVEQVTANTTQLAARADQSGLIGLLRHLHGRGFILMSITSDIDRNGSPCRQCQ